MFKNILRRIKNLGGLKAIFVITKSFYFNIKIFGIKRAMQFPIFFNLGIKINVRKNSIKLPPNIHIFYGFSGAVEISKSSDAILIIKDGILEFKGKAVFCEKPSIIINKGKIVIGKNFSSNKNLMIAIDESILEIGDDVLLGSNVRIRDDGHPINGKKEKSLIKVGNHVWVGEFVNILKDVKIGDNCVIGAHSVLLREWDNKEENKTNLLIAGYPAKVKKRNIYWEV